MSKSFYVLCALTLSSMNSAWAVETYTCRGDQETRGTVTLTLDPATSAVQIVGTVQNESYFTDNSPTPVRCAGRGGRLYRGKQYVSLRRTRTCDAETVGLPPTLSRARRGLVVISDSSGGDTHDYSGYRYLYFNCTRR